MKTFLQKTVFASLFIAGGLVASTAHANSGLIDGNGAQAILNVAKGFGSAELGKDSGGDPKITGRINGTKYGIYFYACTNGKNCEYMKFATGYETDGKAKLSEINKWNNDHSLGRVMLDDENDVLLDYPVMLHKGVSKATVEESFKYWETIMASVEEDLVSK